MSVVNVSACERALQLSLGRSCTSQLLFGHEAQISPSSRTIAACRSRFWRCGLVVPTRAFISILLEPLIFWKRESGARLEMTR